ncbi:MAG TPA: isoprenylcysteine carboxylmethyltransferase family protein [Pyrinomonadaceae bacterium]|nr:isoprenylcysteine carboxylmethyltransferase family protein [Pyrinomonadaceae bacterium]
MRYFLLIYFIIYFAFAFFLPTYRVWKITKHNPVVFGKSDNAHDYIGKVFKLLMASIFIVVLLQTIFPNFEAYLLPITRLERNEIRIAGIALLLVSLLWTILAQIQMGNSWRVGIDQEKKTDLISSGVFRFSRNPIFLGMMVTLLGLFLIFPNTFTLIVLILGFILIQIQVRLEEEFLTNLHGENYRSYRQSVRRWL